ncbi:MAG: DUF4342 domain-containing protein [Clostridia bacterium]|nr:DUF4342 domain-containing protein [Clostridia bacterium]
MITLEQVEEFMRTSDVDFALAAEALRAADGDFDAAKAFVEARRAAQEAAEAEAEGESAQAEGNTSGSADETAEDEAKEPNAEDILHTLREVLGKVNASNILIRKDGKTILNLSCTIGAIGLILAPIASLIGLGAAVLTSYEILIILADGRELNLTAMTKDEVNDVKKGWEYYTSRRHERRDEEKDTADTAST